MSVGTLTKQYLRSIYIIQTGNNINFNKQVINLHRLNSIGILEKAINMEHLFGVS